MLAAERQEDSVLRASAKGHPISFSGAFDAGMRIKSSIALRAQFAKFFEKVRLNLISTLIDR
jgi:hypothetical protein